MDTLTKKKEIRQKLQRKLTNQAAEIKRLKRECDRKDADIQRLGGVRFDRDNKGVRIGIEMMVDDREAQYYVQMWDAIFWELGFKLGGKVWEEKTRQAFSNGFVPPGFVPPREMEHIKYDWMSDVARSSSPMDGCPNYRQLESAWNSALETITKYANQSLHSRRLRDCRGMGEGAGYAAHSAATQPERLSSRG